MTRVINNISAALYISYVTYKLNYKKIFCLNNPENDRKCDAGQNEVKRAKDQGEMSIGKCKIKKFLKSYLII